MHHHHHHHHSKIQMSRSVHVRLRASPSLLVGLSLPACPDSPWIAVPAGLNSKGLTSVVIELWKELVPTGVDLLAHVPILTFRDITRDVVIRQTLEAHIQKHNLTEEEQLLLEYSPPIGKPEERGPGASTSDWISSTCTFSTPQQQHVMVFAGTFDGCVEVLVDSGNGASTLITEPNAHGDDSPIKTICCVSPTRVLSGAKNGTIAIWDYKTSSSSLHRLATCVGHTDSVESIDVRVGTDNPNDLLICSGGWDGSIRLFQANLPLTTTTNDDDDEHNNTLVAKKSRSNKTRRTNPLGTIISEAFSLQGHKDKISGICWADDDGDTKQQTPVRCFSSSWDRSIRAWDVVRQVEILTLQCSKPPTCIAHLPSRHVVACGHHDFAIRLWDVRQGGETVSKLSLQDHNAWVSHVAFEGGESALLASCSHDRSIRVWDIRAMGQGAKPLFKVDNIIEGGKLFSVSWGKCMGQKVLYCGGSDAKLRTFVLRDGL